MMRSNPAASGFRMTHMELPRALEDYFAHAETAPTRAGRRFTITLPYLDDQRLDRLQWWWQVSAAQELQGGQALERGSHLSSSSCFRRLDSARSAAPLSAAG